jgi:hypothetical protein
MVYMLRSLLLISVVASPVWAQDVAPTPPDMVVDGFADEKVENISAAIDGWSDVLGNGAPCQLAETEEEIRFI